MALTAHLPPENPTTGTRGTQVKPITEGKKVMATQEQESGGGFWSGLDDLGGSLLSGIGNIAGAVAEREADDIRTGVESAVDSTGNQNDQPGGANPNIKMSFVDKYKTELMIGAGVLIAAAVYMAVRK